MSFGIGSITCPQPEMILYLFQVDSEAIRAYFCFMPTVLRIGPYRFFFYAGERDEAPHVHVEREDYIAKFWLDLVRLVHSSGFSRKEINEIQRHVEENQAHLLRSWNEFFSR